MSEIVSQLDRVSHYFGFAEWYVSSIGEGVPEDEASGLRWAIPHSLILGQEALAGLNRKISDIETLQAMEELRSFRASILAAPYDISIDRVQRAVDAGQVVVAHLEKVECVKEGDRARGDIVAYAAALFGGTDAAWEWMARPVEGLDQKRPIDLMKDPNGRAAVEDYLVRIDDNVNT